MHRSREFGNRGATAALLALLFAVLPALVVAQEKATVPRVTLVPGLVITHSVRVRPGRYRLRAPESPDSPASPASPESALITVRGDNITVDLTGVEVEGIPPAADPDLARGIALRVEGGRNVRIVNGTIRGYAIAIMARGTHNLSLVNNDLSYNWKPRLFSLREHESLVDWLSFHHNEKDEWLRFGAAIYLADVRGGELRGNTARQGMNGLLMVRTDSLLVHDNDFSFNSGLGVGMYRSTHNHVLHNRVEFDVRGYSHGYYRRGQDSAGILMYEQSSGNLVAYNTVTHGGDGLFLWAGQSTMDSGKGGANDNVFLRNDFSFAPTNAMEATFSRNDFIGNRANGSDYGLWGGYSYNSRIIGNCFAGNRIVIAIEHGQENVISGNLFAGDSTPVKLWADSIQPSDWGYPKHRDTRNRDNRVEANTSVLTGTAQRRGSPKSSAGVRQATSPASDDVCAGVPPVSPELALPGSSVPAAQRGQPPSPLAARDRSAIIVDEWGPYDWRSPKLWPVDSTHASPLRLVVLGPAGRWRVREQRGIAALSGSTGRVGDTIVVTPAAASSGNWDIALEYIGSGTVSPRGERRAPGVPYAFGFGRFEPFVRWDVRFQTWSDLTDPRTKPAAFAELMRGEPILARTESRLDYMWYRPTVTGVPQARFAIEATAAVTLPAGEFTLRTISDDAVRVWVDGVLAIDHWDPHESAVDFITLPSGSHAIRVLYFQVEGWTELRVDVVRGDQRSRGSAGPH